MGKPVFSAGELTDAAARRRKDAAAASALQDCAKAHRLQVLAILSYSNATGTIMSDMLTYSA